MDIEIFINKRYIIDNDTLEEFKKHCIKNNVEVDKYELLDYIELNYDNGIDAFMVDENIEDIIVDWNEWNEFLKKLKDD
jgi:hypothetical protein